jgi:DNA-binding NtrC family response regulator
VLVADGDPSLRAQLIGLLRDAGLDVIEAEHGRSASNWRPSYAHRSSSLTGLCQR